MSLPLVVDLDGTLTAADLLHETATRYLVAKPWAALNLLAWARKGPAPLKAALAEAAEIDIDVLPYHPELAAWLREEAASGRTIVLASASNEHLVRAVADHVGIFTDVLGSSATVNLRSERKAAALVERFGERGFEYVGNHKHDLPVWEHAAVAHTVTSSSSLRTRAYAVSEAGREFEPTHAKPKALIKALRPHQWVKNALVLLPLLTAQLLNNRLAITHAVEGFAIFSVLASSVYVLNDLADLDNDRHHHKKRTRPFASGAVSLVHGWLAWPVMAAAAFVASALLEPWEFTAVLAGYYVLTLAYTFWLKSKPVADVVTLAGLYTVRVVAGIAAIHVPASMWLLTFSLFFFLSLALIKRVSELTRARRDGAKPKGRGYRNSDLELLSSYGVSTSVAAAVIFALYENDPKTLRLYQTPELLWGALPIMLTWLMRAWILAHRGAMDEDPILFAVRDRWSMVAGVAIACVFIAAKVVHP